MTREHCILSGFILLAVTVFISVVRKGLHCPRRFWGGVLALVGLSVLAIGLNCLPHDGIEKFDLTTPKLSLPEIWLGILLLALACLGCMCADQRQ